MDDVSAALKAAQDKAEALFNQVLERGLITAGKLESELTEEIHEIARSQFGLRRHWHKRLVRAGPNAVKGYHDETEDRAIGEDDVVYLDFGPVFGEWEADFGRSYALGSDPDKHRLVADLSEAFHQGKEHFRRSPELTAGQLYDYVANLAVEKGWQFGGMTAGHLIGHFPHERAPSDPTRFSIRHGNDVSLREKDSAGATRHWILEIHLVDHKRQFGGFLEELLTV
jgi:Xaa-Pro aminopeptidase